MGGGGRGGRERETTGQKSPRALSGTGARFKEEGFYEREILQQTVCTHLTDQYTRRGRSQRTKLPRYIPLPLPSPSSSFTNPSPFASSSALRRAQTFAAITRLKLEATLLSVLSLRGRGEKEKKKIEKEKGREAKDLSPAAY